MDSREYYVPEMEKEVLEETNMPVRILHVVTYMGRGGLETMLMNYYRNIDREKVQFDFLTHRSEEADYDQEILSMGGQIYHLPKLNPFSKNYLHALDTFFKEHPEYRIVHSHLDCMAGIPLKYAKKNGVPVCIAHAHNSSQVKDKKYLLKLFYKRNIPKYSNIRFACGKDAGDWMFNGAKYQLLHNAIDAAQYSFDEEIRNRVRKDLGIPDHTYVIGEVARISPQKNHSFLIDIFAEVINQEVDAMLLIVGDGMLAEQIKNKVAHLGLTDKVIFTGVRDDVPQLLQAMDTFVMPSLFEGLGVAVVEAQAAGLPCVISDKVPIECEKTKGLVYQVPLSGGEQSWYKQLIDVRNIARRNTYLEIAESGYDIKENSNKLERYYLNLYATKC